ncbi:MAG TPA: FAD-dependent oxidoreductase, partial [Albitalea sp.]|nr:FAD-dependent oxidoreductase [Albitalea sp.]
MATKEVDLFVIGGGSGGVRAGRMAAQLGARVAVAEMGPLGGTCVNLGCIPKKLYSYAAHYAEAFAEAHGFGWALAAPAFDWERLKANRAHEIARLNGVYETALLANGATLLRERARVASAHEVEVAGERWRAQHILVATGGHPLMPDLPGAELAVSSDAMFDLPRFPRRLVVIGAGYIACEMASIFRGLGAEVTQLVRGPQLLRGFDDDVARFLAAEMVKKGVRLRLATRPLAIARDGDALRVTLDDGQALAADTVLAATGRVPNTRGLGLEEAGVQLGD